MLKPSWTRLLDGSQSKSDIFLVHLVLFDLIVQMPTDTSPHIGHPPVRPKFVQPAMLFCSLSSLKKRSNRNSRSCLSCSQDTFLVIVSVVEIFSQFMATQRLETATSNLDTMSNMRVSSSDLGQTGCGNTTGAVVSSGAGGSNLVLGFQSY